MTWIHLGIARRQRPSLRYILLCDWIDGQAEIYSAFPSSSKSLAAILVFLAWTVAADSTALLTKQDNWELAMWSNVHVPIAWGNLPHERNSAEEITLALKELAFIATVKYSNVLAQLDEKWTTTNPISTLTKILLASRNPDPIFDDVFRSGGNGLDQRIFWGNKDMPRTTCGTVSIRISAGRQRSPIADHFWWLKAESGPPDMDILAWLGVEHVE